MIKLQRDKKKTTNKQQIEKSLTIDWAKENTNDDGDGDDDELNSLHTRSYTRNIHIARDKPYECHSAK